MRHAEHWALFPLMNMGLWQENVDAHLTKTKTNHEEALKALQDLYSKYKFIEQRLSQSKANLKSKMPEIKKTLEALKVEFILVF